VVLYKSVVNVLRKVHLLPSDKPKTERKHRRLVWAIALVLLVILAVVLLLWSGII
jgi:polyferredoxin